MAVRRPSFDSSNLFESTPILVDAVDLSRKSIRITSSGFRPLVYVVVMREKDWDALTSRVQLGLTAEITKSAGEVTADATNRETSALTSLFKKGFVSVNTTEMDKSVPEGAWRAAFGDKQPEVTNLILWVAGQAGQIPPPEKRLVPEKHGDIEFSKTIPLLFATDRRDDYDTDQDARYRFANTPGKVSYGVASISTDPNRRSTEELGETELRNIDVFDVEEFKQKVATALKIYRNKSVLIYIHGYKTTFRDAALSAKTLKR